MLPALLVRSRDNRARSKALCAASEALIIRASGLMPRRLRIAGASDARIPTEETLLRLTIRAKITAGVLPGAPPNSLRVGTEDCGGRCAACDEVITVGSGEIMLQPSGGVPSISLHGLCFTIWREECGHQ
jgi:hypothetical protein